MKTTSVSTARGRLYRLLDEVTASREPVLIAGKRGNAVLVPEEDWRAIQETLYLLSVPGMRESIRDGLATPPSECAADLKWWTGGSFSRPRPRKDPFQTPPRFERLVGDLKGACSRRINIQHRLVYQVLEHDKLVKVLRLWTHYE
jgi:prevent-host-death family protein